MATWQYRCVSCGSLHDAPLRPGGAVFLRCIVTRQWAWHEPSTFISAGPVTAPVGRTEKARSARSHAVPRRRASAVRARQRTSGARKVTRHRPASRRPARRRRGAR